MKADPTYLLKSLSNNDITFFIPPYQRNYEWSTSNCRTLLSDIKKVAESNSDGQNREHFFGSIVYVVEDSGFGLPDKYVLTDGQQRITTTMLFLMALRDSVEDQEYQKTIQSRYLQNERAEDGTEYKIKLKQVETDWEGYKRLALRQEVPDSLKSSAVYKNYIFFHKELEPLDDLTKKSLLENGLTRFSIIAIQLEPDRNPWENPQEIFESMNSLGKPLSLADLVRNYLLMGKSSGEQTDLYNKFWLTLEKRLAGRLSEFIRDWMQADQHKSYKVAKESNHKELYGVFKGIVQDREVEELFESFVRFSKPYSIICGLNPTANRRLNQVISDLNIIGVAPAYSYLSEVLDSWRSDSFSDQDVVDILSGVRTYLLRRRVLGITQAENRFFPVLGARIGELVASDDLMDTLFQQLSSQEYALRLPNDDEMIFRLRTLNFYNLGRSRSYPRLLLSMAEEKLTKARPAWEDDVLQLEHIMPQKLNEEWRLMLGNDAEFIHQEYVNNVGNITLIRHNQELGNRSFEHKKATYQGQSGLQVTQNYVVDQDVWGKDEIDRRQEYIVNILIQSILEIPPQFKRASNWNRDSRDSTQFDARTTMNQLIGEKIEFSANSTITAHVVSDSKVLFEGEEWALGPLTKMIKERIGETVSRTSNFHGSSYWVWEGSRLVDLDL